MLNHRIVTGLLRLIKSTFNGITKCCISPLTCTVTWFWFDPMTYHAIGSLIIDRAHKQPHSWLRNVRALTTLTVDWTSRSIQGESGPPRCTGRRLFAAPDIHFFQGGWFQQCWLDWFEGRPEAKWLNSDNSSVKSQLDLHEITWNELVWEIWINTKILIIDLNWGTAGQCVQVWSNEKGEGNLSLLCKRY